jgi:excisionase family DNA binding protein
VQQPQAWSAACEGPIPTLGDLPPTLTVEQAAEILGCGRSLAYDLIRRDEFPSPVLRLGNRWYVIPTAGLLRVVGIGEQTPGGTDP